MTAPGGSVRPEWWPKRPNLSYTTDDDYIEAQRQMAERVMAKAMIERMRSGLQTAKNLGLTGDDALNYMAQELRSIEMEALE